MVIKIIGATCIFCACAGFGYYLAWQHQSDIRMLRQILLVLEYMECELQDRRTPLPVLCYKCAEDTTGTVADVFRDLAVSLESKLLVDPDTCMKMILSKRHSIPHNTQSVLKMLGMQLGKFDLGGQVRCLESIKSTCTRLLQKLSNETQLDERRYKTLGLCVGAALIIIFI